MKADTHPHNFVARVVHMLEEAADGVVLVETRLGSDMADRPDCLTLFRAAERQVQAQYPCLRATATPFLHLKWEAEKVARMVQTCLEWAGNKLIYGVDVLNQPYDTEADWSAAYRITERLAETGLGITVHVAEVAPVNVAAVLRMPGITRLGHTTPGNFCRGQYDRPSGHLFSQHGARRVGVALRPHPSGGASTGVVAVCQGSAAAVRRYAL